MKLFECNKGIKLIKLIKIKKKIILFNEII